MYVQSIDRTFVGATLEPDEVRKGEDRCFEFQGECPINLGLDIYTLIAYNFY